MDIKSVAVARTLQSLRWSGFLMEKLAIPPASPCSRSMVRTEVRCMSALITKGQSSCTRKASKRGDMNYARRTADPRLTRIQFE